MTVRPASGPAAPLMAVLGLEEREPDVFVGQTPTHRQQRIFGGQVAGQALMAAGLTVPSDRGVHSLHSYFLRPGDPHEEIRYAVERHARRPLVHHPAGASPGSAARARTSRSSRSTADYTAGEPALVEHALPEARRPGPDGLPGIPEMVGRAPGGPAGACR